MNSIDIIIPVRNEAKNLSELVKRIATTIKPLKIAYQLIFIDDHSTDKTLEVLSVLKNVYPIQIFKKRGKLGKSYSILEGVRYATSEYVVMIDADLQYPPEVIAQMIEKSKRYEVVVARRKKYQDSAVRKIFSQTFNTFFGKILHGFNCDVQSGLKLFKREIALHISPKNVTPWTLDLSLLHTAKDLGYSIGEVNINFNKRVFGKSKVNLFKTSFEIAKEAMKLKLMRSRTFPIVSKSGMLNAGVAHKGKRYITHTTLPYWKTALHTFIGWQKAFIFLCLELLIFGIIVNPLLTVIIVVGVLSLIYFIDVLFNLFVILKSLHNPPDILVDEAKINNIDERILPIYTILCPLYKEGKVLPHFLESIEKIEWPKNRLDVIILLEEDDKETALVAKKIDLPKYVRVLTVPQSLPKTKPKACNYGLNFAKGEFLVIYDAEDKPDPLQLKKAYLAFLTADREVVCLQAKLNYFNPNQNLLTRLFTAEYSLWFDVILTGLQSIKTSIPLGGTSNHFRTNVLKYLQGWDPFNVTEDCDLGIRLYMLGFKTAIIDSTTEEEANSNSKNWIRQRSRWIKGYMQTYLVHMRNPLDFIKQHGVHAFIFQLIIGARISFMLINPILWIVTISYFAFYEYVGLAIESVYPSIIFYMAAFSLVFGNFMYLYNYMIGISKKEKWELEKYIFLIPIYWLLASAAAYVALYQLIVKPHYWEKTHHGLHLKNKKENQQIPIFKPLLQPIKYVYDAIF